MIYIAATIFHHMMYATAIGLMGSVGYSATEHQRTAMLLGNSQWTSLLLVDGTAEEVAGASSVRDA